MTVGAMTLRDVCPVRQCRRIQRDRPPTPNGSLSGCAHRTHELIVSACIVRSRLQQERLGVELLSARPGVLRLQRGSSE